VKNGSLARKDFKPGLLPAIQSGSDGSNGSDGSSGADGASGSDGTDGANGSDGTDGVNGTDGANGTDGVDGAQGPPGPQGPQGPEGPQGVQGPPGVDGVGGARAYGVVSPTCTGGSCPVTKNLGITSVTRVMTGNYCVNASPYTNGGSPAFATVDFTSTTPPQAQTSVIVESGTSICPTVQFSVMTTRRTTQSVKNTSNVTVSVGGADQYVNDVGFVFLVP